MGLSISQHQFAHALGTTVLADLGFAPDSPELPGILREAANNMRIHKEQGRAALNANLDALKAQDAKRADNIINVGLGAALVGLLAGLEDIEAIASALDALAAQLEAHFQPAAASRI